MILSYFGFQVSAIVLISSCVDILMAKPCDLEKALDLLGLDEYSPCAYSPIKDLSIVIIVCGVIMLVVNLFLFLVTSCVKKLKKSLLIAVSIANIFNTTILNFLIICINTLYLMTKCKLVYSLFLLQLLVLSEWGYSISFL